jgi:hypothetical protein
MLVAPDETGALEEATGELEEEPKARVVEPGEELAWGLVAEAGLGPFFSRNNEKSAELFIMAAKLPAMFCAVNTSSDSGLSASSGSL